jgi:hypothetical protein
MFTGRVFPFNKDILSDLIGCRVRAKQSTVVGSTNKQTNKQTNKKNQANPYQNPSVLGSLPVIGIQDSAAQIDLML